MRFSLCVLALAALAPAARADLLFGATLLPTSEVPPHSSSATGTIFVDLHADLTTLDVFETFSGLAAAASAAHIHCCAPAGTNASVRLPFVGFPAVTSGTYMHTFNLTTDLTGITTADFLTGLEGGMAYANIHDASFPGGDIRGQLAPVPEPSSVSLVAGCLLALALYRRRPA